MEELLPLIIGIIWLVYTIYSKGKKRALKREHAEDVSETKAPSIIDQLFAGKDVFNTHSYEVDDEYAENQFIDQLEEEPANVPKEEAQPFLKTELADFVNEGQTAIVSSDTYLKEENEDIEKWVEGHDFDLRKAIIFSEILNAPYIGYK